MLAQQTQSAKEKAFNTEGTESHREQGRVDRRKNRLVMFNKIQRALLFPYSVFSVPSVLKAFRIECARTYIFSNSRRCLVCARLTGTSDPCLSAILSM